jgi:type II secretory pathway component PulJ
MKKEILKGFSLLALIIALALMTAVASANAQSIGIVKTNASSQFLSDDATLSNRQTKLSKH